MGFRACLLSIYICILWPGSDLVWGHSQTTLTRFWLFLATYPPALTLSMVWMLTKSEHFWTTYLPCLVNVVCERPLTVNKPIQKNWDSFFGIYHRCMHYHQRQEITFPITIFGCGVQSLDSQVYFIWETNNFKGIIGKILSWSDKEIKSAKKFAST